MPQWWDAFMLWLDTSTIPLWVIFVAVLLYLGYALFRLRVLSVRLKSPPPRR